LKHGNKREDKYVYRRPNEARKRVYNTRNTERGIIDKIRKKTQKRMVGIFGV